VGVLGKEHRVLPALLKHSRQCARIHTVMCWVISNAEIHSSESSDL
jgi:hypothetical protein